MRKFLLFLIGLSLFCIIFSGCSKEKTVISDTTPPINVEIMPATRGDFNLQTALSGKITALDQADVSSKLTAKVENIHVTIGDFVTKGDILLSLDKTDYSANLEQTKASYDMALANYHNSMAQIQIAKKNYGRMLKLFKEGALSKSELEKAELKASDINIELIKAQLSQAKALLTKAENAYADCNIYAPISGFITNVSISPGEIPSPTMPIISISNINPIIVETNVSGYLINKLKKDDIVDVFIKSITAKPFKGSIYAISPAPSTNSFTYPVQISIKNNDSIIKPGMFAEVVVSSAKKDNTLTIPSHCVVIKDGKSIVFVVENNIAKMKEITLGLDNGELVEIIDGLNVGDKIVSKGQNYLEDGNKVKFIK